MKKILISTCILSMAIFAPAMAEDTITGHYVNLLNNKINKAASPLVNKENEINQKQNQLKQQQQDKQAAQQRLIDNKKQQVQNQKNLLNQEKNNIKSLFTIE